MIQGKMKVIKIAEKTTDDGSPLHKVMMVPISCDGYELGGMLRLRTPSPLQGIEVGDEIAVTLAPVSE